MEIKIECSCGSRYKFDLEPVNGRSPVALACPNCQTSWTDQANAIIARSQVASPAAASSSGQAPPPVMAPPVGSPSLALATGGTSQPRSIPTENAGSAPPIPAPPIPAAPRSGLRLSGHASRSSTPEAPAATPADAPVAAPPPSSGRPIPRVVGLDPLQEPQVNMGNFGLGVLGAAAGAAIGGLIYYLLFIHTDLRLKPLALGVGLLAALGAKLLSKDRTKELGLIAAVLSIGVLVGIQYFIAKSWFNEADQEDPKVEAVSYYDRAVAEARQVVGAITNGTDVEIRVYLAKAMAEEGERPDYRAVTKDDIHLFRTEELPRYRDLASGKITKEAFEKELGLAQTPEERQQEKEEAERTFKYVFIALTLSKFNLVCLAGAAGIAYKMLADA